MHTIQSKFNKHFLKCSRHWNTNNEAFFNFGSFYFLPKIVILNWGARHHLLPLQRSYFKAISLLATNKPNTYLLIVEWSIYCLIPFYSPPQLHLLVLFRGQASVSLMGVRNCLIMISSFLHPTINITDCSPRSLRDGQRKIFLNRENIFNAPLEPWRQTRLFYVGYNI